MDNSTDRRITVFDTTLRDGEQAPGNAMTPGQKLDMALRIEALGVDRVEAGYPAASPRDLEATRMIAEKLTRAQCVTFCRAVRRDIELAVQAAGTTDHQVELAGVGSDIHLEHKRQMTRTEAIAEIVDMVGFARSCGVDDVAVAVEDATRGDAGYLRRFTDAVVEAGATRVVVPDTVGATTPEEYADLLARFRAWMPPEVGLSTHCHDDFGLAVVNTVAGVAAGADEVQVALGGVGERAGNASLEQVVALLAYKGEQYGGHTGVELSGLYDAYTVLREYIGLEEPRNKPLFGTYAFGTAAGIHQQGLLRNPETYEYVQPADFGRATSILVGRHSGRAVLRHLLEDLDVVVDDAQLEELYRVHVAERPGGDCEDLTVLREHLRHALAPAPGELAEVR